MSDNQENSGRVTTREFFNALLAQNDRMDKMERRILERVDRSIEVQQEYQTRADARFAADYVRIGALEDDVDKLKLWDKGIAILSIIGSAFGIGIDK